MATMSIECDERDKLDSAREAKSEYTGSTPSVTCTFRKRMGRARRTPLDPGNEGSNEESLAAIREAEQMARDGAGEGCATTLELIDAGPRRERAGGEFVGDIRRRRDHRLETHSLPRGGG